MKVNTSNNMKVSTAVTYLEPYQTTMMEFFFQNKLLFTISTKNSFINI